MKGSLALLALAGAAIASPLPQAAESSDCSPDYDGEFTITVVNVTSSAKRDLSRRQLDGILTLTLEGGVLTDQAGRTGYIAANRQFQFDNPIQAGAVITEGWGVCGNQSLSLEGSSIFYQCLSGEFYNLYDESQGGQCNAIYIMVMGGGAASPAAATEAADGQPAVTTAGVSQIGDGQVQAATSGAAVTQIGDGQIQAPTGAPVTQIGDGQIQAPTGAPVTQIGDGQIQAPTGAPVTQIGDGQIQAPTGAPVTQIGDGQIQAPTGAPVTQIGDGQIQAPTGAPVTQIGDGQIQAPTATGAPVTQIGDGQIQAPTATGAPVTQIGDGQVQAPTSGAAVTQIGDGQVQAPTGTTAAVATYTGAANREFAGSFAIVAGIVGAVVML